MRSQIESRDNRRRSGGVSEAVGYVLLDMIVEFGRRRAVGALGW